MSEKSIIMISPEFFSLSPEKQRYLISKIEQKIYLTADLQSKDKNEEEIKGMGFFKKALATFGKDQRQVALRDKIIAEIKNKRFGRIWVRYCYDKLIFVRCARSKICKK
jgi:hypothetical protein